MFSRLFGQFLLQEGIVSSSSLSNALGRLGEVRPLIGMLALAQGFMTPDQVLEVNEAQKKVDRRFGELAIEKGYLTVQQLESIISAQKSEHVLLGQILVQDGFMSHEGFLKALELYRTKAGLTDEGYEAVKANDVDGVISSVLAGQPGARRPLVGKWGSVFMKSVIRFVDPGTALDPLAEASYSNLRGFVQRMSGEQRITVFLGAHDDVYVDLARRFTDFEDIVSYDEMAEAGVGEFLNLANGLFTVNCSDEGIELDMHPQEMVERVSSIDMPRPDAVFPFLLPKGLLWTGIRLERAW
ncbi:MAG: hypothetical protein GX181_01145 [Synergistaceae bacterium]|nr:hypothetical protein [Synergistota bacterium]NLM70551.1 hypothetical protein [Synergistaceae bacterium]